MRRLERCHLVPMGRPLQAGGLSPHGHQGPNGGHYLPPSSGPNMLQLQTQSTPRGPSFHSSLGLNAQFPPGHLLLTSSGPPFPLAPGPGPHVAVAPHGPLHLRVAGGAHHGGANLQHLEIIQWKYLHHKTDK